MDSREALLKKLRSVLALAMVVLYVAGLVAMFASSVQLALILWVVSTLGGGGMLYWLHTRKQRQEAEEKARAEADDGKKDGQGPCA